MGLTLEDVDIIIYNNLRAKGYTHEETIKIFPKEIDFTKTPSERHFGMRGIYIVGIIIIAISILLCFI